LDSQAGATIVTVGTTAITGLDFVVELSRALPPPVVTSGCRNGPSPIAAPSQPVASTDFVELERTACFLSCSQYAVRIVANGQIFWKGTKDVKVLGDVTASVDAEKARNLIERYRVSEFWSLCGGPGPADSPLLLTTVRIGAEERRVTTFSHQQMPDSLRNLMDETERLADAHRWIHGDPQKELISEVLRESGLKPGWTPLMQAAVSADVNEIQKALGAKADPNARDSSGWTALFYAAQGVKSGPLDAVTYSSGPAAMRVLLDAGADPNARSFMDQTALMSAASSFYSPLDRVKLLIANGADVNAQDKNGKTVLMQLMNGALTNGRMYEERTQLCSLLRSAGARTDLRDAAGLTVFDLLAEQLAPYIAPPQPGEVRWWDAAVIEARAVGLRQSLRN
jgi:hypothetical protein